MGTNYGSPIWTRQGTQGNSWKQGQVQIPAQSSQYQVVFEGLVGSSYRGDIGVDDIKLLQGPCTTAGTHIFIYLFNIYFVSSDVLISQVKLLKEYVKFLNRYMI